MEKGGAEVKEAKMAKDDPRAERLAQALRDNLRRRKNQGREQRAAPAATDAESLTPEAAPSPK